MVLFIKNKYLLRLNRTLNFMKHIITINLLNFRKDKKRDY